MINVDQMGRVFITRHLAYWSQQCENAQKNIENTKQCKRESHAVDF